MSTGTRPIHEPHRRPAHSDDEAPARRIASWPLVRHYLEMVITMAVGMVVLHPLWAVGLDASGLPGALDQATVMVLVMATDMSLGMGAWMWHRGHSLRPIVEMSATMYLPFLVLLPLVWAGVMSAGAMITAGHVVMLPTMFALMVWRRDEYDHGRHTATPRQGR
jgi:hypothetical protein